MINFKKSIILTMMVSILAPQVAFACKDDASCQPAVNDHINKVVRNASKKLPSSIREEFINILYQALTKKYKGECFINNKVAITGVVIGFAVSAPIIVGTSLVKAINILMTRKDAKNSKATLEAQRVQAGMTSEVAALGKSLGDLGLPLAALGLTTTGTALETTAAGGNAQGSTTIGGIIAKYPQALSQVTQVCTEIAKKLGTHFYSEKGSCWGNSTDAKLKFKPFENMNKTNPQIIDLNGKNDGIPVANPAASP
jgi:hypothetical protein